MKVICIHHRLAGYTSHHFNEAAGFMREMARRGHEFILQVHVSAPPPIVEELRAFPLWDDPTFRLEWSFEERTRRFVELLHQHVDPIVSAGDLVLLTIATQLEAHALARWLESLPAEKKPWIAVVILGDRWNRFGRDEYERQMAELRTLRATLAAMAAADARLLMFFTVSEAFAAELTEIIGTAVGYVPMPLDYGDPRSFPAPPRDSKLPLVAVLGGTRREKGSYLIPDIIRACRAHVDVEFLVHLANNSLTAEEAAAFASVAEEPGVSVIAEAVPHDEYKTAINSSDLGLFPYELIPYRVRTSGVFAETVAFGKPVVVTPGTWMAKEIEAGRAAGVVADDTRPESFARAIAACVADLEALTKRAGELREEWSRTVSTTEFLDRIDRAMAVR
jgi:glycosyltransferase involved in cell wall biosynthesis